MARKPRILIVDGEEGIRTYVTELLTGEGFTATAVTNADEALAALAKERYDLAITEVFLTGLSGIELVKRAAEEARGVPIVIMGRDAPVRTIVSGMRAGAVDYIEKPIDLDRLRIAVDQALGRARLERENAALRRQAAAAQEGPELVAGSEAMREVIRTADLIAPTDLSILVEGESGVGKELVARRIHAKSPRAGMPLIAINCGAVQPGLLESELFGHEKGAFTGAISERAGLFELADRGSLFLDEIGEMPLDLQVKLLRVLETSEFRRVGGQRTVRVDVRIIAATNRRLGEEVRKGTFREDLFYRLNVVQIEVPPLRRRPEEIPGLVDAFVERARLRGMRPKRFTPDAIEAMGSYGWPGNVRELENLVERGLILAHGDEITAADLPQLLRAQDVAAPIAADDPDMTLAEVERRHIVRALRKHKWNKVRTARKLGINVKTLYNKIKAYEISEAGGMANFPGPGLHKH